MKNHKSSFLLFTALLWFNAAVPSYGLEFPDTGDRGAPSSTAGGGTRGGWCESEVAWADTSLFALVPKNNVSTFAGDQASLWIRLASGLSEQRAEIFVQNAQTNEVVYREQRVLESFEDAHTLRIDLPATQASGEPLLSPEHTYKWEFAVICDNGDRALDYFIKGFIQPVQADTTLRSQIEEASAEEQAELYANAGIWQETLMIAQQLKATQPGLLLDLLASVGLDADNLGTQAWADDTSDGTASETAQNEMTQGEMAKGEMNQGEMNQGEMAESASQ